MIVRDLRAGKLLPVRRNHIGGGGGGSGGGQHGSCIDAIIASQHAHASMSMTHSFSYQRKAASTIYVAR
jgi:hypothetical protein